MNDKLEAGLLNTIKLLEERNSKLEYALRSGNELHLLAKSRIKQLDNSVKYWENEDSKSGSPIC